jgi:hypothetical protein
MDFPLLDIDLNVTPPGSPVCETQYPGWKRRREECDDVDEHCSKKKRSENRNIIVTGSTAKEFSDDVDRYLKFIDVENKIKDRQLNLDRSKQSDRKPLHLELCLSQDNVSPPSKKKHDPTSSPLSIRSLNFSTIEYLEDKENLQAEKVISPLSKHRSKTKKKKSRSVSKQKPHYYALDQKGDIISSPFKIPKKKCAKLKCPTSVPQIPVKKCKLKKEVSSPCTPEVQKRSEQLDRMRMPPPPSPTDIRTPSSIISPFRSPSPQERYALNSPLLRRPPTNPSYSPIVPSIFSESPTIGEEWKISDYYFNSEDSSENDEKEKERNYKYWCRRENLVKILEKQVEIDPDAIFGPPNHICDLEKIFNSSRHTYRRTDRLSGCWSPCSVQTFDSF